MVIDFAKDQGVTDVTTLNSLLKNVKRGDLTSVLLSYEKDIKNPLKNAISGDLIRTLLIQGDFLFIKVHKTKCDGELAMSALDKLLRSNELNFALLATVPSILLISFFVKYLFISIKSTGKISKIKKYFYIRIALRS